MIKLNYLVVLSLFILLTEFIYCSNEFVRNLYGGDDELFTNSAERKLISIEQEIRSLDYLKEMINSKNINFQSELHYHVKRSINILFMCIFQNNKTLKENILRNVAESEEKTILAGLLDGGNIFYLQENKTFNDLLRKNSEVRNMLVNEIDVIKNMAITKKAKLSEKFKLVTLV